MAQLSRPYQLALAFIAVLALAWFTVLHAQVSGSAGGSSSSPSASAKPTSPKAGAIEQNEGRPTPVYHGSAPGVQGLSKDIRRAHETVGASEAEAQTAQGGSVSAPSQARSGAAVPAAHPAARAAGPAVEVSHRAAAKVHSAAAKHGSRASTVEAQLHAGKVVLLLFWKPASLDDQAVHSQVLAVGGSLKGKVALDFAKPSEVGSFGTVTRDVSVLQTPTLLIINRKGQTTTLSGLTDAFSIEQAVREAGG